MAVLPLDVEGEMDARRPHEPADPGEPTPTDTDVTYARDLVTELVALNALAADIDHRCEPRWWPHHIGEHWECDTCGHGYHVARAEDMGDETSAKAIRLGILKPDTLGWQSDV